VTAEQLCIVVLGATRISSAPGCYQADDIAGYPPDAEESTAAEVVAAVLGV
jgi:hypothetical protein